MKRFSDVLQDESEARKDHFTGRVDVGISHGQEGTVTIRGQVELLGDFVRNLVESSTGSKHSGAVLRTEEGRVIVYLGPAWYFCQHDFPIRAGDILEISGSTIFLSLQQQIFLAKEVRTKRKKIKIRDAQGRPLWRRR